MSQPSREAVNQQAKQDSSGGNNGYEKNEYHAKFEKGKDARYFRLLPAHINVEGVENATALEKKVTAFFNVFDKRQKKQSNKPIFNAVYHGGATKDIVREYINFAKAQIESEFGVKTAESEYALKMLSQGSNLKDPKVKEDFTDVAWAIEVDSKGEEMGSPKLLTIKYTVKKAMQEIANEHFKDEIDDPALAFATFYLDLDTAYAVGIKIDADNKYVVSTLGRSEMVNGKKIPNIPFQIAISDEGYDKWSELKPLALILRNQYKASDWDYQIEGLSNFETYISTNPQVGSFFTFLETPEFQEIMDSVKADVFAAIGEDYDSAPAQKSRPLAEREEQEPTPKSSNVKVARTGEEDEAPEEEEQDQSETALAERARIEEALARRKAKVAGK